MNIISTFSKPKIKNTFFLLDPTTLRRAASANTSLDAINKKTNGNSIPAKIKFFTSGEAIKKSVCNFFCKLAFYG